MKSNKIRAIFSALLLTIISCNIQKTPYKKRNYTIVIVNTATNNAVVYGSVKEYNSKLNTISPKLKIDDQEWQEIDIKTGFYKFSISPGKHDIRIGALGYKSVQISNIKFNYGDSVKIDFYLDPITKPLI